MLEHLPQCASAGGLFFSMPEMSILRFSFFPGHRSLGHLSYPFRVLEPLLLSLCTCLASDEKPTLDLPLSVGCAAPDVEGLYWDGASVSFSACFSNLDFCFASLHCLFCVLKFMISLS